MVNTATPADVPRDMTTKIEPSGTNPDDHPPESTPATNGSPRTEATKPLTVMLPEDLLRKLRVIAVLRDKSISEIVADHVEGLVKRDLKKVLAKLDV